MKKRIAALLLSMIMLATPALAAFDDVPGDQWYAEAVEWAEAEGIMNGVADGRFDPAGGVTRAMFVTILYRMAGSPAAPESGWGYAYADVDASQWYADAVYWAREEGVAGGVSDERFDPNGAITREMFVTMLYRYAGEPESSAALSFADAASVSLWAQDAVAWAAGLGVVSGRDGNIFDPAGGTTRAECAAMLMRFDAAFESDDTPDFETIYEDDYIPNLELLAPNRYDAADFRVEDGRVYYGEGSLTGIDVSVHQGEIDWEAVAADGIDFAIIRVGYRGYSEGELFIDEYFEENITGALRNGIAVGVYFFSQALSVEEAIEEARMTVDAIRPYDVTGPVVFDWERITYDNGRTELLSADTVTDCARAFCEEVESWGYQPMCYTSPNSANSDIYLDRLTDYPLWLAHYTEDMAPSGYPYHYDMWQYTSSGSVDGIEGGVDLNVLMPGLWI